MFNFVTIEYIKEYNPSWTKISDCSYQILITGDSGFRKTHALLNLKNNELDTDEIYLYAKDPSEAKYQLLINKIKSTGLKYFNDSKTFIKYSINLNNIYKNIEKYELLSII